MAEARASAAARVGASMRASLKTEIWRRVGWSGVRARQDVENGAVQTISK